MFTSDGSEHKHSSSWEGKLFTIAGSFMAPLLVYDSSRESVVTCLVEQLKSFSEQVKTRVTTGICTGFKQTHAEELEHDLMTNSTTGIYILNRCELGPCTKGHTHTHTLQEQLELSLSLSHSHMHAHMRTHTDAQGASNVGGVSTGSRRSSCEKSMSAPTQGSETKFQPFKK